MRMVRVVVVSTRELYSPCTPATYSRAYPGFPMLRMASRGPEWPAWARSRAGKLGPRVHPGAWILETRGPGRPASSLMQPHGFRRDCNLSFADGATEQTPRLAGLSQTGKLRPLPCFPSAFSLSTFSHTAIQTKEDPET